MSRRISWVAILMMALMVLFTVSCEGPAGVDGVDGVDGADGMDGADGAVGPAGADGTDGTDGVDGNMSCLTCHTQANMDMIKGEFAVSGHAAAGALGYAGGRGSCSRCHSAEGFAGYLLGYPGEDLTQKSALSCESCHGNHESLEDGISAPMATMAAINLIVDETTSADFGNASNLCANCHNSRRNGDYYTSVDSLDLDGDGVNDFEIHADSVWISSTHAGPHYSAQVNTIIGLGGYGATATTAHESVGCVSCHMGDATLTQGGHTFDPNLANCTVACHSAVAADFANWVSGKQDAVSARMAAIGDALVAAGAMTTDGAGHYSPARAMVHIDVFEAFWNYRVMYQDHSFSVHNPGYYTSMLATAEAKLGL